MTTLNDLLTNAHILPRLADCLAFGDRCYLVGGALRDFFLGRSATDFDFATPGDPTRLARRFASRIGGRWFMMDRIRRQSRVVLKTSDQCLTYDFAPFRSDDLAMDLRLRDFTVNAIALELSPSGSSPAICDPLNGRDDLQNSILRACSSEVFQDDPLRLLRGIRLAASLKMEFDQNTLVMLGSAVDGLARVSAERVRSELSLIFAVDPPTEALRRMDVLGLLAQIFGYPCGEKSFAEGIDRVARVSQHLPAVMAAMSFAADSVESDSELSNAAVIRMATFLSVSGALERNPLLLKQLRFSKRNDTNLRSLAALQPARVSELLKLTGPGRGRALWVSRLGPDPLLSLVYLLCLIDRPESLIDRAGRAFGDYLKLLENGRIPDLVDGGWIGSELGVSQGQVIGRYLSQLRQAEIEGRVRTLNEAHKFLKSLAQKTIDKKNDPS